MKNATQTAFIAGVADANGYGWAIAKVGGWVFIGLNTDIEQRVSILSNASLNWNTRGDFFKPPKIDIFHSRNWCWMKHGF